jgi:hypothetical protein
MGNFAVEVVLAREWMIEAGMRRLEETSIASPAVDNKVLA